MFTDLEYEINRKKETVFALGNSFQPLVVATGNTIQSLHSIYVNIDGARYLMNSIWKL